MTNKGTAFKSLLSSKLRNFPLIMGLMHGVFKWTQARFTAGVVGVVLNQENEILLVEHVFHPKFPWGLPGGWLQSREAPAEGLIRELREETGVSIRILAPLCVDTGYYYRNHLDIAFLCFAESDVLRLSGELMDFRWAAPDSLPTMLPFHEAAIAAANSGKVVKK